MCLRWMNLLILFSLVVLSAAHNDGSDHRSSLDHDLAIFSGSYEFYFHHSNNLLLTVHRDECYYSSLSKSSYEDLLQEQPYEVETRLMMSIRDHEYRHPTTLDEMRERYQDLLADFHCIGKQIYTLNCTFYSKITEGK